VLGEELVEMAEELGQPASVVGNMTSVKDPLGNVTTYTYNAWNQVLTTKDALGRTTTNNYDPNTGDLVSTVDAFGYATIFTYGRDGQQTSRTTRTGYTVRPHRC
jgi:YD repeat-containing protein